MVEVLHALKAPLMIPMHYFSAYTLDRFLQRVRQDWEVEIAEVPSRWCPRPACRPSRKSWCCPATEAGRDLRAHGIIKNT